MTFLDDFLVRAALAGLGVAVAAAPLGCFVVWRRMAYFGDATAHAAILGVALALALSLSVTVGVLVVALSVGLAVGSLNRPGTRGPAADTLLGVLAHSALALGLVAAAMVPRSRVDLNTYLFGDILTVQPADLAVIWIGAAVVCALMYWRWSALLTATLSPELARAAGIDPRREQVFLSVALAVVVAVAIKVVGALLISAMLIIPAAAARPFVRTPEGMLLGAGLIGAVSVAGGLQGAFVLDTPAGPSIVVAAAIAFAAGTLAARFRTAARD